MLNSKPVNLLTAWRDFRVDSAPFLLDEDRPVLTSPSAAKRSVTHRSWREFTRDLARDDKQFHFGLLPIPFIGHLEKAKIVFLLLNPGLEPADYFGEFEVEGFRRRLVDNLRQNFSVSEYPFLYLDPAISWHSGYRYWHGKFKRIIEQLADEKWGKVRYQEARRQFANLVACLQLVPYLSASYHLSDTDRKQLTSTNLALEYVRTVLHSRSQAGEVLIIVTRKTKVWDLKASEHVIVYSNSEVRAAHLTPATSTRITEFLGKLGPDRTSSNV